MDRPSTSSTYSPETYLKKYGLEPDDQEVSSCSPTFDPVAWDYAEEGVGFSATDKASAIKSNLQALEAQLAHVGTQQHDRPPLQALDSNRLPTAHSGKAAWGATPMQQPLHKPATEDASTAGRAGPSRPMPKLSPATTGGSSLSALLDDLEQAVMQQPLPTRRRESEASSATTVAAPDGELPVWVAALTHKDARLVDNALSQLCDQTMWQESNQREVAELGGPSLVVQLIKSRLRYIQGSATSPIASEQDIDVQAVVKALTVLMQLSANDDLAVRIATIPGCVALLVGLLAHAHRPIMVHAARCLINLTHSSGEAQAAALQAGAIEHAARLLFWDAPQHAPPPPASDVAYAASSKLACWLLANLTASFSSPARVMLLSQLPVVQRLAHLASPGSAQGAVTVITCHVLRNLARAGASAQTQLAGMGVLARIAAHLTAREMPESVVLAAALETLCALVMDHADNTAALVGTPGLASKLSLSLETRHSPFECDSDDSTVLLAAHCLIHVLGHMLVNTATSTQGVGKGQWSGGLPQPPGLLEPDMVDGRASVMVPSEYDTAKPSTDTHKIVQGQQAVYISLSASARAVGVELPAQRRVEPKDGSSALSPVEAAELRHQVTHVLLPKLRSANHHSAATAAACVYHLAAACGGPTAKAARRLMADGALVAQLLDNCASGDPALTLASLMVLDVLSADGECVGVMMSSTWLPSVVPLLQSDDGLVRRFAERALCSLYMGTGGGGPATCASV